MIKEAEKTIQERSIPGQSAVLLPEPDVPTRKPEELLPAHLLRKSEPRLPEVSEPELVRHYLNLSVKNHHVDKGFYPLGSCTMKYNPKINEWTAAAGIFRDAHPWQPEELSQAQLRVMGELDEYLRAVTGMSRFTLQPAAGAQGELTGVLIMRRYHLARGNQKSEIIIPDSAHGTNPASVAMGGFKPVTIKSSPDGSVDLEDLRRHVSEATAGLMLTNPNTLGLFENNLPEISRLIHEVDGLMYMDGANLNALLGYVKPADLGFDITHINLHKTFSTPHGGGGPGAGPIGVVEKLEPYLPVPLVERTENGWRLNWDRPQSIGRLHTFYGNFGVLVRAWTYFRLMGPEGLKEITRNALLNANYLRTKLEKSYDLPYKRPAMHEFVLSAIRQKQKGVRALDIAKRLLDFGLHAPTIYFPLIVKEALMIEPTESESKATLDYFIEVMERIAREAEENPEVVTSAPHNTPIRRVDETRANRQLKIRW